MAPRRVPDADIIKIDETHYEVLSSRDRNLRHHVEVNPEKHTGVCSCPGDGSIERAGTATVCRHVQGVLKMVSKNQDTDKAVAIREADLGTPMTALAPTQYIPQRDELRSMMELANFLYTGDMIPKGIKKPQDMMLVLLYGRQLEIDPMTACQKLFVIDGRIGMYAELMLALAKRNDPTVETKFAWSDNPVSCTCELYRKGKLAQSYTYTLEDATRSGQAKKAGPWQTYRRDMMAWNAAKRALRLGAPDLYLAVHPSRFAAAAETFADDAIEGSAVVIEDEAEPEPLPAPAAIPPESNMGHTAANPGGLASESTETPPAAVEPARAPDHADRVTELRGLLKLASTKLKPEEFDGLKDAMKAAYPSAMGRGPDGVVRFGPSNLSSDELTEAIADITRILAPTPAASEAAQPTEAAVVDPDDLPFE